MTIPRTGPEEAAADHVETAAPIVKKRKHFPRTKIVGTLGPSSNTPEAIRSLIEAGLDVARINFSHGTHEQHARTIKTVRAVADELGRPVAILGDLQGPRIRIGDLPEIVELPTGHAGRRYAPFWRYNLPAGRHTVRITVRPLPADTTLFLERVIIYGPEPKRPPV